MASLIEGRGDEGIGPRSARLVSLAVLIVCGAPLFVLTVRAWSNWVLFLGAIASMLLLASGRLPAPALRREDRPWVKAVVLGYAAPIVAAALSAVLRRDPELSLFDAPSRFLLAIPIFFLVLRSGRSVARRMQWVLPVALALALASLTIFGQDPKWDADRATTRVVDPLVFGYFSLAFGLMCLVSFSPGDWSRGRRWGLLLRAAGVVLGVYLSIRSGSRTGWLALPIVIALWGHYHWGRGRPLATAAVLAAAVLLPLLAYLLVPVVSLRVDTAVRQVLDYPWHGGVLRGESSAGYRIAFLRMAVDVLALHPWAGVGDTSHVAPLPPEVFPYVAPEVVAQAFGAGFHNQIVSNAVRMGIAGLLATTALMLTPLLVCWRGCRKGPAAVRGDALMGLAYCICVVVSSVSTEVVDLKYAASFYAVMTAAFCGAVLAARTERAGAA